MFPSSAGAHYYPFNAARWFWEALVAAGFPDECDGKLIDFHATRRSIRTWLVGAVANDADMDRVMGHSPRGTARRHYTADDVERLRPVVAKIELDVAVADVIELPFDDDESGEPRLAQSLAQAAPSPHRRSCLKRLLSLKNSPTKLVVHLWWRKVKAIL